MRNLRLPSRKFVLAWNTRCILTAIWVPFSCWRYPFGFCCGPERPQWDLMIWNKSNISELCLVHYRLGGWFWSKKAAESSSIQRARGDRLHTIWKWRDLKQHLKMLFLTHLDGVPARTTGSRYSDHPWWWQWTIATLGVAWFVLDWVWLCGGGVIRLSRRQWLRLASWFFRRQASTKRMQVERQLRANLLTGLGF